VKVILEGGLARCRHSAITLREYLRPGGTDLRLPNAVKISEFRRVVRGLPAARGRVLDLGCGAGLQSALLAAAGFDVTAVDPDRENIAYATRRGAGRHARRVVYRLGTLEELGLPSETFDAVVSFGVLEHVDDPHSTLAAAARLLRPGGTLHLTADAMNHVRDEAFLRTFEISYDVRRLWDVLSVAKVVAESGLAPYEVRYVLGGPTALGEVAHHLTTGATRTPRENRRILRAVTWEEQDALSGGQFVLVRAQRRPN
jgi:SAM-dependent methyltransferase